MVGRQILEACRLAGRLRIDRADSKVPGIRRLPLDDGSDAVARNGIRDALVEACVHELRHRVVCDGVGVEEHLILELSDHDPHLLVEQLLLPVEHVQIEVTADEDVVGQHRRSNRVSDVRPCRREGSDGRLHVVDDATGYILVVIEDQGTIHTDPESGSSILIPVPDVGGMLVGPCHGRIECHAHRGEHLHAEFLDEGVQRRPWREVEQRFRHAGQLVLIGEDPQALSAPARLRSIYGTVLLRIIEESDEEPKAVGRFVVRDSSSG